MPRTSKHSEQQSAVPFTDGVDSTEQYADSKPKEPILPDKSCGRCIFCDTRLYPVAPNPKSGKMPQTICALNPPQVTGDNPYGNFPVISKSEDWCGQFKAM